MEKFFILMVSERITSGKIAENIIMRKEEDRPFDDRRSVFLYSVLEMLRYSKIKNSMQKVTGDVTLVGYDISK